MVFSRSCLDLNVSPVKIVLGHIGQGRWKEREIRFHGTRRGRNRRGIFFFFFFAMAKIRRIGHDHHAPFQDLVVLVVVLVVISSGDARRKQAAT